MVDWHLNPALTAFRSEVNARYPNRDKTSDGTVGDLAHQATNSDHNPDSDGSVDAWDMDIELNGSGKPYDKDLWAVINAALKHESIQYVIYNCKITSRTWGLGVWRDYTGPSPHDHHVHFNTRSAYENSTKPWLPKEPDMPLENADVMKIWTWDLVDGDATEVAYKMLLRAADSATSANKAVATLRADVTALKAAVADFASKPVTTTVTVDIANPEVLSAIAKAVVDELNRRTVE